MDLVVHSETKRELESLVAQPPQAALLSGSAGIGKSLLARQVASQLLATIGGLLKNNPYYREVLPVKGTITIEQVRKLIQFFSLSVPGHAAVKRVAVIVDADSLGLEAQNALLKLLEEPPVGSLLLLTSTRPLGLLPTVRSRLQQLVVADPPAETLQTYFESSGLTSGAVNQALIRHGSNVAAIQAMLTNSENSDDKSVAIAKQVLQGSQYERLLIVDSLAKQKDEAAALVDTLAAIAMASLDRAAQSNTGSLPRWQTVLQAALTAQNALDKNGNTKLVLTELMLAL